MKKGHSTHKTDRKINLLWETGRELTKTIEMIVMVSDQAMENLHCMNDTLENNRPWTNDEAKKCMYLKSLRETSTKQHLY